MSFARSPKLVRPRYLLLIVLTVVLWNSNASSSATDDTTLVSTATPEGRLVVFDDVWETIQERYYDPSLQGIDWQARRNSFRPAAAKATGTHEFYVVLRQLISALKDAHTRVYSPEEKFDWWSPRYVTVGVAIRDVEGVPTVVGVEQNSTAAKSGIRSGDIILTVDDEPAAELIQKRLRLSDAPVEIRSRIVSTLLDGPPGSSVGISWQSRDGKTKSASLQRYWNQRQLSFSSDRKGKLLVLRLDAFTQSVSSDFSKALPALLKDSHGIILDLRGNGGGDAEAMADIASLFLNDGINLGRFADRSGAAFELQTYFKRVWRVPLPSQVKLPLVVLTSENTSSAAEILVAALQTNKRARVIGAGTCGCVLAIRNRHALPDGGVLDVSEFDYRTASGVRLEGRGVKPDEVVSLTRRDLYSRRDIALTQAISYLKTVMMRTQSSF
jgi:carboxyl-terminal processing protease